MKFMRLLMFGTVLLMANGAGARNTVKPFHLDEATISDVHAAYRSALTSVRLLQAYLERIRACDQAGPKLNVVILLNPRALEEAAALDEHFRSTGKFVGPLHGIPVQLKDNVNTKDMPTTGGSLSLAGYTPVTDAAITQKLRSADAIILAKVNLHEFAIWGDTVSSIQGQTLNPYDLTRTPGELPARRILRGETAAVSQWSRSRHRNRDSPKTSCQAARNNPRYCGLRKLTVGESSEDFAVETYG
jgi:hypothetical protein